MNCNCNCTSCCPSSDSSLWILLMAFALTGSGKEFHLENLLDSDNLPIMLALLYCMCKSGCLSSLLSDILNICGCKNNSENGSCNSSCGENRNSSYNGFCGCNN